MILQRYVYRYPRHDIVVRDVMSLWLYTNYTNEVP